MFVAVEGPTGVGKTTLAERLAPALDAETVLDPFEANPFLPHLLGSESSSATALRAELTFIALRVAQLREIAGLLAAGRSVVADWAMLKQPIFAATTLDPADVSRVEATVSVWADTLPTPDVLIGLSATTTVLHSRVRQRDRAIEAGLTRTHLDTLSAAFDTAYRHWARPLVRVDTTTFNVFDPHHVTGLATQVRRLPKHQEMR